MKIYDISFLEKDLRIKDYLKYRTGYTTAVHFVNLCECGSSPLCIIDFFDDTRQCREDWIEYTKSCGIDFYTKMRLRQYDYYCLVENWDEIPVFHEIAARYEIDLKGLGHSKFFFIESSNDFVTAKCMLNIPLKNQRINGCCGGFGDTDFGGADRRGFVYSDMETIEEFESFFYNNARGVADFMLKDPREYDSPIIRVVKGRLGGWFEKAKGREIKVLRLAYPGLPRWKEDVEFIDKFVFTDIKQLSVINNTGYVAEILKP